MPNIELTTATEQQKEDIRNSIDALGVAKDANGNMTGMVGPNGEVLQEINAASFQGVDPTGVSDSTAGINAALARSGIPSGSGGDGGNYLDVTLPDGIYRIDGSIIIEDGRRLKMSHGARLNRFAASSANTAPIVELLGVGSVLSGGIIRTENAHPNGIVRCGTQGPTDTRNAWWWRLERCIIRGVQTAGNVGVMIASGQITNISRANYFGTLKDLKIKGTGIGIMFAEFANAHTFDNINFWDCVTSAIDIRGAYANVGSNIWVHTGTDGINCLRLLSPTNGGSQQTECNQITNFCVEPGGAASVGILFQPGAQGNYIQGQLNIATAMSGPAAGNTVVNQGAIRGRDGNVVTPTLSFAGEPSSGWYRNAAGVMSLAVLGVDRLTVNSSRRVGINNINPAATLDIVDTNFTGLRLTDSTASQTALFQHHSGSSEWRLYALGARPIKFGVNDNERAGVDSLGLSTSARLRFTSMTAASVDNNSLFVDSADNLLKFKTSTGVVRTINVT